MTTRQTGGMVLAVLVTAAISAAQDKSMPTDKTMNKQMEKTLTGCVTKSDSGTFMLDHAMAAGTGKDMKKESMPHTSMMSPELTTKNMDLSKHVGQKVSVTGSEDMMGGKTTFMVKSLKTIANSCS